MVYIPDIFSGWLAGARQANADNWQDLANYNNVLGGQLNNAFALDTYDPAVRQQWNAGYGSDLSALRGALATDMAVQNYNLAQGSGLPALQNQAAVQSANYTAKQNQTAASLLPQQQQEALARIDAQIAALEAQKNALMLGQQTGGSANANQSTTAGAGNTGAAVPAVPGFNTPSVP